MGDKIVRISGKVRKLLFLINTIIFVYGLQHYFSQSITEDFFGNSVWNVLFAVAAYKIQEEGSKCSVASHKYGMLYGAFFSVALICGREIYFWNSLGELYQAALPFLWAFVRVMSFASVVGNLVALLFENIVDHGRSKEQAYLDPKRSAFLYMIMWGLILLAWLPAYFAYYPGIGNTYDFSDQAAQAYAGIRHYSKHHPPLHTWLLSLAIAYGERTGTMAVTIYAKVQMVFLAAVMARQLFLLQKEKADMSVQLVAALYAMLNPVLAVFALMPVKDAVFSGFFTLFSVKLYELTVNTDKFMEKKRNLVWLALTLLLCCLLRKNMIYVTVLFVPIVLAVVKEYRKKLGITLMGVVLFYLLINDGFYSMLGMSEGQTKEMLCVPMQQIAKTACLEEGLSSTEKAFVGNYLPLEEIRDTYNPRNADPIKYLFSENAYTEHPLEFWKGYLRLGLGHPLCYLDALLSLNLPYWYPDADPVDKFADRSYIETEIDDEDFATSKAPQLLKLYEKAADHSAFEGKPLLSVLFSLATPFWFMLMGLLGRTYGKNKRCALVVVPGLLLWLTYIAGPVSNFRYVYPLIALYPLYLFVLLGVGATETEKERK